MLWGKPSYKSSLTMRTRLVISFLSGDKRMDYERTLKTPSLERAVSSWPTIWHFPVEVASSIESVLCNSLVRKLQNAGNSESKLISFFFFLMTVVDLKKFTELDSHHETFSPKPYWRSSSSETSPFICGDGSLAGQRRDYCVDHATLRSEQSIFVVGLGSESCQEWHSFSPQTSQGLLQGQIVCTVETIP